MSVAIICPHCDFDVPPERRGALISGLRCPKCGSHIFERQKAASDGDYLPGDPMPRGAVPAEPPGAFRDGMHTKHRIDSNWVKCEDGIERPAHYANFPIDPVTFALINELPAWKFQVVKYTCRAGLKGNEGDDIRKAIRHLEMRLELLKRQSEGSLGHVVGRPL